MTDQPQTPGHGGNSGEWQPVPGGGDYDPDQTMHVSFAAQLPPQPRPGEDPLGAHGPAGTPDAATTWSIPVMRDEGDRADSDGDSGEYPVGAFGASWDQAPSPAAPTQSFPAGMFGQGAAAVAAAAQARAAEAESAARAGGEPDGWNAFSEFPEPVPWQPVDPAAAEAAWSAAADPVPDPQFPPAPEPLPEAEGADGAGSAVRPEPLPEAAAPASPADEEGAEDAGEDAGEGAGDPGDPDGAADPGDAVTEPVDAADPETDTGSDADAEPEDGYEDEPPPAEETHSEHPLASYVLRVNGADRPVTDAWLGESLLYVLRERLGLAGAKDGCEQGECGACSVQVDGRLVASCLVPAATAAGSEVRTVEGLSGEGGPCDIQRALADCGAVQCGFCIPGMAMTVHDLLEGNHRPTDLETRQALSGNLCRCTGYRGVVEAVRQVVAARDGEDPPPAASRIPAQSGPSSPEAAV
jgi:aerobic-type carbon monoxide dehydrogenase small subunit (CoxS/CutS family)